MDRWTPVQQEAKYPPAPSYKNSIGFPCIRGIKYKSAGMFQYVTGSAPSYLSDLLYLFAPRTPIVLGHTPTANSMIQTQDPWFPFFYSFWSLHLDWLIDCLSPANHNEDLRTCSTFSSFKANLKSYLFLQYLLELIVNFFLVHQWCVCVCWAYNSERMVMLNSNCSELFLIV